MTAKAILPLLILLSLANVSLAQKKSVAKVQAPIEWAHYEKNWFKDEKKALKASKKDTKKSVSNSKTSRARVKKLNRFRAQISEISARKEGSDE